MCVSACVYVCVVPLRHGESDGDQTLTSEEVGQHNGDWHKCEVLCYTHDAGGGGQTWVERRERGGGRWRKREGRARRRK